MRSVKTGTLLTLVTLINVACAGLFYSCKAQLHVDIFGFDLNHNRLYYGSYDAPGQTVGLNDPALEKDWIALKLTDWKAVKDYCGIPAALTERTPNARMAEGSKKTLAEL